MKIYIFITQVLFFLFINISYGQYYEVYKESIRSEFFSCPSCNKSGYVTVEKKIKCNNCSDWADSYRNLRGCDVCKNKKYKIVTKSEECYYCNGQGVIKNTYYTQEGRDRRERERLDIEKQNRIDQEKEAAYKRKLKEEAEEERKEAEKKRKEREEQIARKEAIQPYLRTFTISELSESLLGKMVLLNAGIETVFLNKPNNDFQNPITIKGFVVKDKKTNKYFLCETRKLNKFWSVAFNGAIKSHCNKTDVSDKIFHKKEITISCFINYNLGKIDIVSWELSKTNSNSHCLEKTRPSGAGFDHNIEDDYYITANPRNVKIKDTKSKSIIRNNDRINELDLFNSILTGRQKEILHIENWTTITYSKAKRNRSGDIIEVKFVNKNASIGDRRRRYRLLNGEAFQLAEKYVTEFTRRVRY
jgi:hypothetical protein